MKILHICLGCFYIDNYSYQENMLPKYHKELGNEVQIIASTLSFDKNGERCYVKPATYINEYGIKVTRVDYKKFLIKKVNRFFRIFDNFSNIIYDFKPNIIFIHGCQFCDITKIVNYAKRNNVTIFVDNHADFSNSARNFFSKNFIHKILWKSCAKKIEPYARKFYGVLPARVEFLKNVYKINPNKVELLLMGCDDEIVIKVNNKDTYTEVRKKYNINEDDFLIISGGKIDSAKWQVLNLIEAVKRLDNPKIKLIVFGSVTDNIKDKLLSGCDDEKIKYIGWLNSYDTYKLISASNIAIYPGRHSVLWEQTVGTGIPMIVKYWNGTTHIDVGGNVKFLYNDTIEEIEESIKYVLDAENYKKMKKISEDIGMKKFSYREIAKKSISYTKGEN